MIVAIVLYCLAIATLAGCTAWALEQAAIRFGMARRFIWLVALLTSGIVPAVMIADASDPRVIAQSARILSMPMSAETSTSAPTVTQSHVPSWPDRPDWNGWFIGLW